MLTTAGSRCNPSRAWAARSRSNCPSRAGRRTRRRRMADRRPKILVVEDDAALREALTDTLELAGHRVVAAPDGETALSILGREVVDLVLSDVQMPGIDG